MVGRGRSGPRGPSRATGNLAGRSPDLPPGVGILRKWTIRLRSTAGQAMAARTSKPGVKGHGPSGSVRSNRQRPHEAPGDPRIRGSRRPIIGGPSTGVGRIRRQATTDQEASDRRRRRRQGHQGCQGHPFPPSTAGRMWVDCRRGEKMPVQEMMLAAVTERAEPRTPAMASRAFAPRLPHICRTVALGSLRENSPPAGSRGRPADPRRQRAASAWRRGRPGS